MITKTLLFNNTEYVLYDYEDGGKPEIYLKINGELCDEIHENIPHRYIDDWLFVTENYKQLF